jgi:hypothetical protein
VSGHAFLGTYRLGGNILGAPETAAR